MFFYLAFVAFFGVAVVWVLGYRVTAGVLLAIPSSMWLFGPQLSRGLDRTCSVATNAWRSFARRPGRRYCPSCACALRAPRQGRPVAGDECPKCEGNWCDSRALLCWLSPYGTHESTWIAQPHDGLSPSMLCPKCATPLEAGSLERLQPLFARCRACEGYWIDRMTWTWFELTPPKRTPVARAAAPSPAAEFAFRKNP